MKALVAALAASLVTALGALAIDGHASTANATYSLRHGNYARIPALGWTCRVWTLPNSRKPGFFCTTDAKPVVGMWISRHRVFVNTRTSPKRFHGGFVFRY